MKTARIQAIVLASVATAGLFPATAGAQVVGACVNQNTGDVRIVTVGAACPRNTYYLEWNQPQVVPPPPPPPVPQLQVQYHYGLHIPGTWVARAYCPPTWKVMGGGGFALMPGVALTQSHPIATTDGEVATDERAIGWQVGATSESPVQAHVVCAKVS